MQHLYHRSQRPSFGAVYWSKRRLRRIQCVRCPYLLQQSISAYAVVAVSRGVVWPCAVCRDFVVRAHIRNCYEGSDHAPTSPKFCHVHRTFCCRHLGLALSTSTGPAEVMVALQLVISIFGCARYPEASRSTVFPFRAPLRVQLLNVQREG